MWGNSPKKKSTKIDTLIGENTELTGGIKFTGGLHIDGAVRGDIIAEADSDSMLSLSDQGTIEGEIRVPYYIIDGTVIGNVYSSEHVELEAKSRITGDVYYNLMEISLGAQISGQLVHTPDPGKSEPKLKEKATTDDQT